MHRHATYTLSKMIMMMMTNPNTYRRLATRTMRAIRQ